jgi:hypothetical protein
MSPVQSWDFQCGVQASNGASLEVIITHGVEVIHASRIICYGRGSLLLPPHIGLYIAGSPFMLAGVHSTTRLWKTRRFPSSYTFRGVKIRQQVPLTTDQPPVTTVLHFIIYYASALMKELDRDLEINKAPENSNPRHLQLFRQTYTNIFPSDIRLLTSGS